jgi:uracil-DNA glycosylase family 4
MVDTKFYHVTIYHIFKKAMVHQMGFSKEDIELLKLHQEFGVDEFIVDCKIYEEKTKMPIHEKILGPFEAAIESRKLADQANNVSELREMVENFQGCLLSKTATNTVFADGIESSKVMLIGEAPGATEDEKGIPFCGDSGKLLDNIIASIGLTRDKNVYISNTVFWRPPGNRRPTDEELKICLPFVEKHIALVNPDILIMVGSTASYSLFGDLGPVSKQRQKLFKYKNKYVEKEIDSVVIFHPSYLLRQPIQKKAAWDDMLFIKSELAKKGHAI